MRISFGVKLGSLIGLSVLLAIGLFAFVGRLIDLERQQNESTEGAYAVAKASSDLALTVQHAVTQVGEVIMAQNATIARSKSVLLENELEQVDSLRHILMSRVGRRLTEAEKTNLSLKIDEFIAYQKDTAQLCLKFSPQAAIVQATDEPTVASREHMIDEVKRLRNAMVRSAEATREEAAGNRNVATSSSGSFRPHP